MSEPITVSDLREQLLPAIARAIDVLDQEASGHPQIENDFQLRACMQLARLAPFVLTSSTPGVESEGPLMQELPPDLTAEESDRLLKIIEADGQPTDTNN